MKQILEHQFSETMNTLINPLGNHKNKISHVSLYKLDGLSTNETYINKYQHKTNVNSHQLKQSTK